MENPLRSLVWVSTNLTCSSAPLAKKAGVFLFFHSVIHFYICHIYKTKNFSSSNSNIKAARPSRQNREKNCARATERKKNTKKRRKLFSFFIENFPLDMAQLSCWVQSVVEWTRSACGDGNYVHKKWIAFACSLSIYPQLTRIKLRKTQRVTRCAWHIAPESCTRVKLKFTQLRADGSRECFPHLKIS